MLVSVPFEESKFPTGKLDSVNTASSLLNRLTFSVNQYWIVMFASDTREIHNDDTRWQSNRHKYGFPVKSWNPCSRTFAGDFEFRTHHCMLEVTYRKKPSDIYPWLKCWFPVDFCAIQIFICFFAAYDVLISHETSFSICPSPISEWNWILPYCFSLVFIHSDYQVRTWICKSSNFASCNDDYRIFPDLATTKVNVRWRESVCAVDLSSVCCCILFYQARESGKVMRLKEM